MKMATGSEATSELSDVSKGLKPGPRGDEDRQTTITANGLSAKTGHPPDDVTLGLTTDDEIKQNPDKFFESLSSKIEDQLRMLEWEMTSNFQEDAISDFLGNSFYDDDPFHQEVSGGYFEVRDTTSNLKPSRTAHAHDRPRKVSREISVTSSVSSISSILDDDDKHSDVGADGDVENNTSESSRSDSCDSGKGVLAASITLVESDRGKPTLDYFVSQLVTAIMKDISTIFSNDRDAILWARAYDSNIVPNMSTSFSQYHNETDKNIPLESRGVLFSKTFTGDQVSFSDDRWFPHDEIFQFPPVGNHRLQDQLTAGAARRRLQRRGVGSDRSDEPERRIFHKARYQMHDIQHELRRLRSHLHDIKDNRTDSSDQPGD